MLVVTDLQRCPWTDERAVITIGAYDGVHLGHRAVIDQVKRRAAELGARLKAGLQAIDLPQVREVRGLGLMVAAELKTPSAPYLAALAERGVLALTAGASVMRFLPPLVIDEGEIDTVVEQVAAVLGA